MFIWFLAIVGIFRFHQELSKCKSNIIPFKRFFRKEKKKLFESLDTTKVTHNKQFWKTIKPFFCNKSKIA